MEKGKTMSKYVEYGAYYDSRTEQQIMLVERIANTECWIADPFTEKEPYIIVYEGELEEID